MPEFAEGVIEALQLNHLKTHPGVPLRFARGDLQLHGWVYDINTGGVAATTGVPT